MKSPRSAVIRSWLIRLITWDGALPAIIWSAPFLIGWLIPDNRVAIEMAAVTLPIVAFFVRFRVGRRYIAGNYCRAIVRAVQAFVLCFGLLLLALIDCVIVLTHVMPPGTIFETAGDLLVWTGLYSVYLAAMSISMYPGMPGIRRRSRLDEAWQRLTSMIAKIHC